MRHRKPRGRPLDGWLIIDKPPGPDQHRRRQPRPPLVRRPESRPWRHARPAGHRRAADRVRRGHQNRALCDGRHQALPFHPPLRRGARHRRRRRPGHRHHRRPPDRRRDPRRPAAFRGDIMQVPPVFSAIKVAGERAYDLARAGAPPVLEPRPARVDRFELIEPARRRHARCSKCSRARASTCAAWPATSRWPAARSAISPPCAGCGSAPSPKRRRFRWTNCSPRRIPRATSPDLLLPVATALADIPALALTEAEAFGLSQWPGDQPGRR